MGFRHEQQVSLREINNDVHNGYVILRFDNVHITTRLFLHALNHYQQPDGYGPPVWAPPDGTPGPQDALNKRYKITIEEIE